MDDDTTPITAIPYVQRAVKSYLAAGHQALANDEDCALIASAVMAMIRCGPSFFPSEADASLLDRRPLIDILRKKVAETDLPLICASFDKCRPELSGFLVSVTREHRRNPQVVDLLQRAWDSGDALIRARALWRILDLPEISEEWKNRIFEFVLQEWEAFNAVVSRFFGAGQTLASTLERINDRSFPREKRWIYLCPLAYAPSDKNAAKAIITQHLNDPDEFTRHVARTLLDRFFADTTAITSIPYVQEAVKSYLASGHQAPVNVTTALGGSGAGSTSSLSPDDYGFLATAVMERIRQGAAALPDEHDADHLNRRLIIDPLRERVLEADLPFIKQSISEQRPELAGLMLSLLRKFDTTPDIQAFLSTKWQSGSPFLKAHVMWRLLDSEDMTIGMKEEILSFILNNWNVFNQVSFKFLECTPETVVSAVHRRLSGPKFPPTKKWASFSRVVEPATDKAAAKALISLHLTDPDEFNRRVARTLLDRFFPEPS
jgi:hypothetical protein